MVVDSSALLAVLLAEQDGERFADALVRAGDPLLSAATLLEVSIVIHDRLRDQGVSGLDTLIETVGLRTVAVDRPQALVARAAFVRFGKGRHPAGLNFGDCFAYALASSTGRPLLFKGNDFSRTDVESALA